MKTFHDIENDLHEQFMLVADNLAQVTIGTRAILKAIEPCNAFVVHRLASELADAIAIERDCKDGDMVDVISRQSAMLEEFIA